MSAFIVQESIHADHPTHHRTEREATAEIEEMIKRGLAEPGEFNIREIDDSGRTVRVFTPPSPGQPAKTKAARGRRERSGRLRVTDREPDGVVCDVETFLTVVPVEQLRLVTTYSESRCEAQRSTALGGHSG